MKFAIASSGFTALVSFPKSLDISKAIDKKLGAEREVVETKPAGSGPLKRGHVNKSGGGMSVGTERSPEYNVTVPATPEAQEWDGWGTALKPANEPIVLARKPISEKTIAENVLKWGTGGLNIDGCRIPAGKNELKPTVRGAGVHKTGNERLTGWNRDEYDGTYTPNEAGRFPANVILDEEAGKLLDEQTGVLTSGKVKPEGFKGKYTANVYGKYANNVINPETVNGDSGGASRFFYCAKASKKERGEGNNHPTVKPLSLIKYLITLVTPPGGICLDPFEGSGTHALACIDLGVDFIGFELEEEYCNIANLRIERRNNIISDFIKKRQTQDSLKKSSQGIYPSNGLQKS